nr:MAG TPA: hypothetical protein [Caudoviricetes sp.]
MKFFAKNIRLFLLDGISNGRCICELSNWTGVAYKIPRNMIKASEERKELASSGIYFLFGTDDETGNLLVYIGEAENIIYRLKQHLNDKDYWNEVIAFISKDDNLNKAHIKYLENRFYTIAKETNRYIVKNINIPTKSTISEAEEIEMEEFIYNAKLLISTLGHKAFESLLADAQQEDNSEMLHLQFSSRGGTSGRATGKRTNEGFVLLKGSQINPVIAVSMPQGSLKLREQYKHIINENYVITEDILFTSPSGASCFVCGRSSNGLDEWKNTEGVSLKILEQ